MQDLIRVDWSSIPPPVDDGATAHLVGRTLPNLELISSNGQKINLSLLLGITVIFVFPRIRTPSAPSSKHWEMTPGAKGCTPQACAFRDQYDALTKYGVRQLYGVSAQSVQDQHEAVRRLHLPYLMLSDQALALASSLELPTFLFEGSALYKRVSIIAHGSEIQHVIYPVFPPDKNAEAVACWLKENL